MPHPHNDLDDLIRRTYVRPVDEDVAARHLESMDAAVRELVPTPSVRAPAPRRRRALLRPAFATGLALVALPAGLAAAGVDLPDAVSAPYEAVGVDLPNQADERAVERVETTPRPAMPSTATDPADEPARTTPSAKDRRDGTSRSEERSGGRRGDEASDGKRRGDDRSRSGDAPTRGPRDESRTNGNGNRGGSSGTSPGRTKPKQTPGARVGSNPQGNRGARSDAPAAKRTPSDVRPSPPAARGPKPKPAPPAVTKPKPSPAPADRSGSAEPAPAQPDATDTVATTGD